MRSVKGVEISSTHQNMNNSILIPKELNSNKNLFLLDPILSLTVTTINNFRGLLHRLRFLSRIIKRMEWRTPTQFFIANLALCDYLVGVLVLPLLSILQITGEWKFKYTSCLNWIYFHCCLCAVSIRSTLAICVMYMLEWGRILANFILLLIF